MGFLGITLGIDELIEYFQGKYDGLEDWGRTTLDGMAEAVRGEMVSGAPFRLGDLREGHVVVEISEWIREIFSDVPHFDWVVGGTYPHDIWASGWIGGTYLGVERHGQTGTGKQALYWEGAEHPVVHVHHPGTQPNDYPLTALENAQGIIEEIVNTALQELVS